MIEPFKYCVKLFVWIKQYMDVQKFELHIAVTWGDCDKPENPNK